MTGDDLPYVRAFRGMIADYYDGVVDDEGMMNAMGLLARDDVAASLGMGVADSGERPLSDVLLDGVPGRTSRWRAIRRRSTRSGRDG